MTKAASKIASDQCPKCKTRDPEAKFCPECGARMGHTGKRGRPVSDEKSCHIFAWVPESLRDQVAKVCEKTDISQGAFLRAAIERELKMRMKHHGKRTAKN